MSKRPLVPPFLQSLDDKLLRNKPGTWASRVHLVLYLALAFALLLFMFCYAVFFDAKQNSMIENWNIFIGLVVFIGFVFWLIYLLRFNVFKRYGNWDATDGWRDFILYFICIGAMMAVCFVPSAVQTIRANQQFSDSEIINDINEINLNACQLEFNSLPLDWKPDTCKVVDRHVLIPSGNEEVVTDTVVNPPTTFVQSGYHYIDTAELKNKLQYADSLVKLTDSLYVFFACPDYRFVSAYNADELSAVAMMSSADIYHKVLKNHREPDRAALLKRMKDLQTKYAVDDRFYYNDYQQIDINDTYDTRIKKKYDLNRISNGLYNIIQKKLAWQQAWDFYLRVFYYLTLIFTMLVFIFRHSTIKTFFLSVLTAFLLMIMTGLIMAFTYRDEGITVLSFMIIYYAVFGGVALSIFTTRVRTAIQGIALNLFLFGTPFIPLIFWALTRQLRDNNVDYGPGWAEQHRYDAMYVFIAEAAGFTILLLLIQPLFKRLYRKWYAAPEE